MTEAQDLYVVTVQSSFILHPFRNQKFRDQKFTEEDAFIGYQKDTPAAVVFQATHQLERGGLIKSPQGSERTKPVTNTRTRGQDEEDLDTFKKSVSCL